VDREILASNLHGVDLNPEPVEITKLSLWLKTAKRGKLLQDLDASIKCGNSLIADKKRAWPRLRLASGVSGNFRARRLRYRARQPALCPHGDDKTVQALS
jgi:hypothetical protein